MRFRVWLFAILAVAAIVRAIQLFQTLAGPAAEMPLLLDSRVYDQMASQIVMSGLLAGSEAFSLGPLYAYFVALVRWLGAEEPGVVYAVQQLLGLGNIALVALIAKRCCGPRAGIAAAVLIAFYGAAAMLELKLMGSTLATFLGVASVALLLSANERRSTIAAGAAGLLLGAACLARPNTLLFAPLAIGWWWWAQRASALPERTNGRSPTAAAGAFALCCGIALAIAPVTLRNQLVTDEFTLISSQAGVTFFHGNNEKAYGLFASAGAIKGNPLSQPAEQRRIAEQAAGRALTQSEVGRYWFERGLEHLTAEPFGAAGLVARKLGFWLASDEIPVAYALPAERELTPALWLAPVPFGLILALACLGLRTGWRDPPRALLVLFALANLSSILVFYFASRYRLPAVPMLAALAGCGVSETIARLRRPRRPPRELVAWLAPAALIAALSLYPWTDDLHQSAVSQFFNYGNIHSREREPALAIASYQRALPGLDHVAQLHINMAVAYRSLGEHGDAVRHLERALEIHPRAPEVRRALQTERAKLAAADPSMALAGASAAEHPIGPSSERAPSTPGATELSATAATAASLIPHGHRHVERLLVVALDGATWSWINPLIEQGRLPVLARLRARGVWASLETLEPTVSPAIWTTIATGTLPERHGILGFEGVPGQTMETLPNATMRRVKAWWEMLDHAALTSGTVGWWATWPADPLRKGSYLVSDRVAYTRMEAAIGSSSLDPRDTQPADLMAEVRDLIERPNDIDRDAVKRFLHLTDYGIDRRLLASRYTMGRHLPEFKFVYQSDRSHWKIARSLIARQPVDLAAVYFTGIDTLSHLYWHFSFPESLVGHTVAKQKVERFRDVIPLYYELMDRYIGDLLDVAGADTTVMVVSDHGFGPTGRLPWSGGHGRLTQGAPIAPPGVLMISGPGIVGGGVELARARVLDITPTLLALLGLPAAEDMAGRPLVEAFAERSAALPARIVSWEEIGSPRNPTIVPVDPRGEADRLERLRALGYIE